MPRRTRTITRLNQSFLGYYDGTGGSYFPPSGSQSQPALSVASYGSNYAVSAAWASPQTYSVASGSYQPSSSLTNPAPQASPSYATGPASHGSRYQDSSQSESQSYIAGSIDIRQPSESSYATMNNISIINRNNLIPQRSLQTSHIRVFM
jgi:hypothetical protein